MKLIQQKILYFKEGNSDKVYEVDLCESGNDLYVVNFRYGRRDNVFRDGTKTIFPVAFDEAVQIFDKLVSSKVKKGYSDELDSASSVAMQTLPQQENTARDEVVLRYLKEGAAGTYTRNWKISKVILRAGVLKLNAAAPLIHHFVLSEDEFEAYAAIKTLALFNDDSVITNVFSVYRKRGLDNKVGRIAAAYALKFQLLNYHSEIIRAVKQKLPSEIIEHLNNTDGLLGALAMHYMQAEGINPMTLYYLYLISNEQSELRKPLLEFIKNTTFRVDTFKSVRYIFRAAEALDDLDFFALISKKIGVDKAGHNLDYVHTNGEWVWVNEEMKKPNPKVAFSKKTQHYFIHNIYKYVLRLSQENPDAYITLATEFLCLLDNKKDKAKADTKYFYDYDYSTHNYSVTYHQYPRYSKFSALMYILYGESERLKRKKTNWYYEGNPVELKNQGREEVLGEEWDKHPLAVIKILANSRSEEATAFAFKIIKAHPDFLDLADGRQLNQIIKNDDSEVVEFLITYLEEKYKVEQPPSDLILSLLDSENEKALALSKNWLAKFESTYLSQKEFVIALLLSGNLYAVEYLDALYKENLAYTHQITLAEIEPLMSAKNDYSFEYLIAAANLFGTPFFGKLVHDVKMDDILNLLRDDRAEIVIIAANLCKHQSSWIFAIFKDRVQDYIQSSNPDLRRLGIEILGHFPNDYLIENSRQIGRFYFSEHHEVRAAIQPAMARLIKLDSSFKKGIFEQSLQTLSEPETYPGLHETVYNLLLSEYKPEIKSLNKDAIIDLTLSKYNYAQELATPPFRDLIRLPNFTMDQLVRLAKSDIREVRDFIQVYFNENKQRVNLELETALHIFNSDWKDLFDWSFSYFENEIKPENWTLELLLYSCDHIKPEVQAFGRKLVLTYFTDEKGLDLLLRLQEHPSKGMQFFATSYLDNYAKDKPEVIFKLKDFFKTVLFNINENRATKTRVFAFLKQETIKNEDVAKMTVDLVEVILTTETQIDQSHCIDLLLIVAEYYPAIQLPITVKEV